MHETKTLSDIAAQLDATLDELKTMSAPDAPRIAEVRGQIDLAMEQHTISVKEWRELVEKCSRIRRAPR